METPYPFWEATLGKGLTTLTIKKLFCISGIFCISICVSLSFHWIPLRTAWLHLHLPSLSGIYTHREAPLSVLFSRLNSPSNSILFLHDRCISPALRRGHLSQPADNIFLVHCKTLLLQGQIATSCSTRWPPGLPGLFLQSYFPAGHTPACPGPWVPSFPDTECAISLC